MQPFSENQIIQISGKELISVFLEWEKMRKPEPENKKMCIRQVSQHLKEKGYMAKSLTTVRGILTKHGISPFETINKENWYLASHIEKIPSRLTKK